MMNKDDYSIQKLVLKKTVTA